MQNILAHELEEKLHKLALPFPVGSIHWRVTHRSQDGARGCVVPYGDPRAYQDRLNQLFTPAGWECQYEVRTLSPVIRIHQGTTISTCKVLVTCRLTIHGLGPQSGNGEMWADVGNALTRAEAQSFKRACSCFGLGRYFYDFPEMWVDLDARGAPLRTPALPAWAMPPSTVPQGPRLTKTTAPPTPLPPKAEHDLRPGVHVLDPTLTRKIEEIEREVGLALSREVYARCGKATHARGLPNVDAQRLVVAQRGLMQRGVRRARQLAGQMPEQDFYRTLDTHHVPSLAGVPSFATLKQLVRDLLAVANAKAA
ncbi:MAG: Rad52/Rad22 family DNA repair protein [Acidobacteriaceae bacterium]